MSNLQGLLDEIRQAGTDPERISLADLQRRLGRRSFGPILLVAGLPSLTPIATVPGLPTTLAIIILLTAGQMLLGLPHVWLPQAILRRSVPRPRIERMAEFLRPAARFVDRIVRPRLTMLTHEPFVRLIALLCCLLALTMPPLEFIPFTGGIPAFPVAVFGLALIAHDGALVIVGIAAIVIAAAAALLVVPWLAGLL